MQHHRNQNSVVWCIHSGCTGSPTGRTAPPVVPPVCAVEPLTVALPVGDPVQPEYMNHTALFWFLWCCIFRMLSSHSCWFRVSPSCLCLGGSSSRSAPRKTKKRVRRAPRPADSEEEVVIPTKPTRREKSATVKQRVMMPLHR